MWVLPESLAPTARALARLWDRESTGLRAPPLFRAEVTSTIRKWLHNGELQLADAEAALEESFSWPIVVQDAGDALQRTALELATQFNRPKAYDAQYLALAEILGCEFWTGDKRLYNAVSSKLPWVNWVGDFET